MSAVSVTLSASLLIVLASLSHSGRTAAASGSSGVVHLAVAGRTSGTPTIAASGRFVAVVWGASAGNGKADVFIATSVDGGVTFGAPRQVNQLAGEARVGGELPPVVSLRPRGARVPEIAVLWTARGATTSIKVSRSGDGALTFSAPRELQTPGTPGDRGWPALALTRSGVAHAVWLDHRGLAEAAAHVHTGKSATLDGAAMAQRSGLYFASAGGPLRREVRVAPGVCYCCKTALAVGADGALYAAWRHVYPGNIRDIAFAVSRDGGRTFSSPVRVSEDGWAINGCPDDGPALAVDQQGTVHVVWPTVASRGSGLEGALYYASTQDGRRFTPRARIGTLGGPRPSHPRIALQRGRVFVAWDEQRGDRRIAAVQSWRPGAQPAAPAVEILNAVGTASYPALAAGDAGIVAAWVSVGDDGARTVAVRRIAVE